MNHADPLAGEVRRRSTSAPHWHDQALWFVRAKRDKAAAVAAGMGSAARDGRGDQSAHDVATWPTTWSSSSANATRLGAVVHWARDAAEHNEIVLEHPASSTACKRLVKSKSMLTEECHLNPFLEAARHRGRSTPTSASGSCSCAGEPPSHIVLPAIHIKKEEVGELFHEQLGTDEGRDRSRRTWPKPRGSTCARSSCRPTPGITGVNFAIAETGGFVVCTNEGNADLGVSLPKLHIACMGIEKLIPRAGDLGVFLRLLARSATGQPITPTRSHFHGPRPGGELHIVLVDNGRSEILGSDEFRRSLHCIRCGACMNTCPVYRRSGGHSYDATVPGPIGSILDAGPRRRKASHACRLRAACAARAPTSAR